MKIASIGRLNTNYSQSAKANLNKKQKTEFSIEQPPISKLNSINFQGLINLNKAPKKDYLNITDEAYGALRRRVFNNSRYNKDLPQYCDKLSLVFYDKIFSDEKLNNNITDNWIVKIKKCSYDNERLNKVLATADRVLSDEKLANSEAMGAIAPLMYLSADPDSYKLTNKILSDEKLYNNRNLIFGVAHGYNSLYRSQEFFVNNTNSLLDTYKNDEKLYKNENVKRFLGDIIEELRCENDMNLIKRVLSEDVLKNNRNLLAHMHIILSTIESDKAFEYKNLILDKYLSNPELQKNENVNKALPGWLSTTHNEYQKDIVCKILSNEKMCNNSELIKNSHDFVQCVLDKNRYDVADMILSNEEIYNNKHFIVNSDYNVPVVSCDTDKKVSIVKAILSNPQLYKSPKVYENLYEIIEHERLDILKDVLIPDEHVLKHPRLK